MENQENENTNIESTNNNVSNEDVVVEPVTNSEVKEDEVVMPVVEEDDDNISAPIETIEEVKPSEEKVEEPKTEVAEEVKEEIKSTNPTTAEFAEPVYQPTDNMNIEPKEPRMIGKIKLPGEKGIIFIVVIVVLLVALLFGMDYIKSFVSNIFGGGSAPVKEPVNPTPVKEPEETDPYQEITDSLVITKDEFSISNILISDNTISFKITLIDETFNIKNNNYYVYLYDSNNDLMQYIKLVSPSVEVSNEMNLSFQLTNTIIKKIDVRTIKDDEMPAVTLSSDNITCTDGELKYIYYFVDNGLTRIGEKVNYKKISDDALFNEKVQYYTAQSYIKDNIEGINSSVVKNATILIYNSMADLSVVDLTQVDSVYYFPLGSTPNKVFYDMKGMNYNCS